MDDKPAPGAPLQGIRVLDFTRALSGPFCTAILGDLGAEVIKVERPDGGDESRHWGPKQGGEGGYFMLLNRNKKSVVLDLKSAAGRAAIHRLVASCHVVIENFRPGVAGRLGIDHAALSAIRPDLIYLSISGFGQSGPEAQRPAYDIISQAMSGLMSFNGSAGSPPTRVGESIGDVSTGLYAVIGILSGLLERQRTGHGRYMEVAMVDSLVSMMVTALADTVYGGNTPRRVGSRNPISTPSDCFPTADSHIVMAAANQPMFARLMAAIGRPELADDSRFSTDHARTENEPALRAILTAWTTARTTRDVVDCLQSASVPVAPVKTLPEVLANPHFAARGVLRSVHHPTAGEVTVLQHPLHLGEENRPVTPPPSLGQHTAEVLASVPDTATPNPGPPD